jgi:hypothetical protein
MTDHADLIKRLRSGVIEWCRITHQGHVTDNTPYEAADALEANIKWQQRMVAIMAAGGKLDAYREMGKKLADAEAEIERLRKLDREAATYVETVICMRTKFTGEPPYVGWKGLGLALTERLDELEAEIERLRNFIADECIDVPGSGRALDGD